MKSNRDLLQGLTILNTVLLFTFTEYSYSVQQSSSARTCTWGSRTHTPLHCQQCKVYSVTWIRCAPLHLVALRSPFNDHEHVGRWGGWFSSHAWKLLPFESNRMGCHWTLEFDDRVRSRWRTAVRPGARWPSRHHRQVHSEWTWRRAGKGNLASPTRFSTDRAVKRT